MTIVARAMGVPVIGRLHDIRHSVEEGETILVDGDNGSVIVRPNRALRHRLRTAHGDEPEAPRAVRAAIGRCRPSRMDGVKVSVMVNAGLAEDAAQLDMAGARRHRPVPHRIPVPRLGHAARAANASSGSIPRCSTRPGDKPVVFRTVDIGGDKALPYLADVHDEAENPAMGWRALRLSRSTARP